MATSRRGTSARAATGLAVSALALSLPAALAGGPAPGPAAGATGGSVLVADSFTSLPRSVSWTDGAVLGPWRVAFAGYGSVSRPPGGSVLRLSPLAPSGSDTHSALVLSRASFAPACLALTARIRTAAQLRSVPNPWETAWLVWDYADNDHFSYLALKTNGWELGKRDPAYPGGQRFLATGAVPATAVGTWATAAVQRRAGATGATLSVSIGGRAVTTFMDMERPYSAGAIGFYVEDAVADIDSVDARSC